MAQLFDLKGQRADALAKADEILSAAEDAHREPTASETRRIDASMASVSALNLKIADIESRNTLGQRIAGDPGILLGGGTGDSPSFPSVKQTSIQEALKFASPEAAMQVKALARYVGGDMSALADLTPSGDAGVFIPTMIAGVVERNYAAFTPVVNNCKVWPTADGVPTKFPVISDSESAVILVPAELTGADAVVSGDTPPTEVGGPTMGAYKFSSRPIFLPRETVTDSTLNVLDEILNALLARIYRTQNLTYTKGSGIGEPEGFLLHATAYPVALATALDLDIALDLAYSVPPLYRPNGIYMASDTTVKYLRKLKTGISGDKRDLWREVFSEGNAVLGVPAKLHGYPIVTNNDLDSVGSDGKFAGVSPLVFGDFKRFVVRVAESGTPYIYRFTVPAKDGGAVIAFSRSDSKLIVPSAISKLTALTA